MVFNIDFARKNPNFIMSYFRSRTLLSKNQTSRINERHKHSLPAIQTVIQAPI